MRITWLLRSGQCCIYIHIGFSSSEPGGSETDIMSSSRTFELLKLYHKIAEDGQSPKNNGYFTQQLKHGAKETNGAKT
jgi:hypothetical protein